MKEIERMKMDLYAFMYMNDADIAKFMGVFAKFPVIMYAYIWNI